MSNKLPLPLTRLLSDKPLSSQLFLRLDRKLGNVGDVSKNAPKKATPNALPLPLTRLQSDKPLSDRLPFTLNRRLGEIGETTDPNPTDPKQPDKPKNPFLPLIASCLNVGTRPAVNIGICQNHWVNDQAIANGYYAKRCRAWLVANCHYSFIGHFKHLTNCHRMVLTDTVLLSSCLNSVYARFILLANCHDVKISDTVGFRNCTTEWVQAVAHYRNCTNEPLQPVINFKDCTSHSVKNVLVNNCQSTVTQKAVPVPCRYYPIPEPPPKPVEYACRIRPPSSRLSFNLTRKRNGIPSDKLPFTLICWHDEIPATVPNLGSYVVLNKVTATLGGVEIDPIDFDFKCDVNGYCWSGSINISHSQYVKIKNKLDVERGDEPTIIVTVNGKAYAFIAEDISRNRKFNNFSYNISGRSQTARLGADYAQAQGANGGDSGMIDTALYASQIINAQLAGTGFVVDRFEIGDWLIPANTYSVTNKTPIAVIGDIANACGGFIYSDPLEPKISILPKWKKWAWEVATANADLVIPMGVVQSINDKKRVNPRYNTVTLIGQQASEVYRQRQGREMIAPVENNALYVDEDVVVPKGCTLLSDSGLHNDYTIVARVADKYNLPLAMLSDIWEVSDIEGAFKGIVTGVGLTVKRDNDAVTVWQSVNIDRYLDV